MNSSKPFTWIASAIFAVMALVHVYRILTNFQIVLGSHVMPIWTSYVGALVAAVLSWMLCREARGRSTS